MTFWKHERISLFIYNIAWNRVIKTYFYSSAIKSTTVVHKFLCEKFVYTAITPSFWLRDYATQLQPAVSSSVSIYTTRLCDLNIFPSSIDHEAIHERSVHSTRVLLSAAHLISQVAWPSARPPKKQTLCARCTSAVQTTTELRKIIHA